MLTFCFALAHVFAQDAAVYVSQDVLKARQGGQVTLSISVTVVTSIVVVSTYVELLPST